MPDHSYDLRNRQGCRTAALLHAAADSMPLLNRVESAYARARAIYRLVCPFCAAASAELLREETISGKRLDAISAQIPAGREV